MTKKVVVWDFIAAILVVVEIVVLNAVMKQLGAVTYILIDALAVAVILFVVNCMVQVINKKRNIKMNILNSIVLVLLYMIINVGYGKTSYGVQAKQNLDAVSILEEQTYSGEEESDEGMEIVLTDADSSSQILNYGFYLVVAFIGGQAGIQLSKNKVFSREQK